MTLETSFRKLPQLGSNRDWPLRWQAPLLQALRTMPSLAAACRQVGISYDRLCEVRNQDPVWDAAVTEAREHAVDQLERLLWQRANAGQADPGSLTAMIFALKAYRRQVYGALDRPEQTTVTLDIGERLAATLKAGSGDAAHSTAVLHKGQQQQPPAIEGSYSVTAEQQQRD